MQRIAALNCKLIDTQITELIRRSVAFSCQLHFANCAIKMQHKIVYRAVPARSSMHLVTEPSGHFGEPQEIEELKKLS